jgi:hypothetical protein
MVTNSLGIWKTRDNWNQSIFHFKSIAYLIT